MALKAICFVKFLDFTFLPSKTDLVCSISSSIGAFPPPETDWYVETTILLIVNKSCNGFNAITNCAVEQLGFAIIFFLILFKAFEFTCGTIKGTSGSILKKLELSITKQCLAAFSANFSEIFPPAAKKAIFTFEKSKSSNSLTKISLPWKWIFFPALFDEATK